MVGVTGDGAVVFRQPLGHGVDPRTLAYDLGFVATEPLSAVRDPADDIDLSFRVRAVAGEDRPHQPEPARDAGLALVSTTPAAPRQRVAAYALVTSALGLLATEFSDRTAAPGRWGLPGGGLEDSEQPIDTVRREVAEETRQVVVPDALVEVQSAHWVGRSPRGLVENFHAVRLVYTARCPAPDDPVVVDVGGTTESACWVPLEQWSTLNWTTGWRHLLEDRLRRAQLSRCR